MPSELEPLALTVTPLIGDQTLEMPAIKFFEVGPGVPPHLRQRMQVAHPLDLSS